MIIEIHRPEVEKLVREEIESGHFDTVDDLFLEAIHALREKSTTSTTAAIGQATRRPDWRMMRGMARGHESLTDALTQERAFEKGHDEGRIQGH